MDLRPHIEKFSRRFAEVEAALSDPKAFDNPQRAQELSREYARLKEFDAVGRAYLKAEADLAENRLLLRAETGDSELANDEDVERGPERVGDLECDRHTAARQRQDEHVVAIGIFRQ